MQQVHNGLNFNPLQISLKRLDFLINPKILRISNLEQTDLHLLFLQPYPDRLPLSFFIFSPAFDGSFMIFIQISAKCFAKSLDLMSEMNFFLLPRGCFFTQFILATYSNHSFNHRQFFLFHSVQLAGI